MKTRFSLSNVLALALPLGLLISSGMSARASETPASAPAGVRGRTVISNKLDRILLENVAFDGLPLGEVVRLFVDESRRRDPDKKGINFMINPNPPPPIESSGTPPPESVDVSAIMVKISPPLKDVRLIDVLDAVVKVAERPIQYSVEDYGVVFSLAGYEPAPQEHTWFEFAGGHPSEFLDAVQKQFRVDWSSVAEIPNEMEVVRIPKMRINRESLALLVKRTGVPNEPLAVLVSLYNQLGEHKPELGRLIVQGDPAKPSVVMFVPDKAAAEKQPKLKVKAFSIYSLSSAERANLTRDIDRAREEAMKYAEAARARGASDAGRFVEGSVAIHNETSLLVATGPDSFVDMVESIVNASQAKARESGPAANPSRASER